MGCDIHAHLEIKISGEWLYYSPVNIRRNYTVFARMANVRNFSGSVTPISSPRGLPADATFITRLHRDMYGVAGHSNSWLSHAELVNLIDWLNNEIPTESGTPWKHSFLDDVLLFDRTVYSWKKYPEDYPESVQDVRLVFWFDN